MSISNLSSANYRNIYTGDIYLKTTGGTAAPINYYDETALSMVVSGGVAGTLTGLIRRINNVVTICFDQLSAAAGSAAPISSAAGALATLYRPTVADVYLPCCVIDGNTHKLGYLKISTAGTLAFYVDVSGSNFGTSGNNGVSHGSVTYEL